MLKAHPDREGFWRIVDRSNPPRDQGVCPQENLRIQNETVKAGTCSPVSFWMRR